MKFWLRKFVGLLLVSITVLLSMAGCSKKDGDRNNTVSIGYQSGKYDMIISSSDDIKCDYLLVYNDTASYAEIDACIDFLERLSVSLPATFQLCPDTLNVPNENQKIITLGSVDYNQSVTSAQIMNSIRRNNYYDYLVRSYGNIVTINWASKYGREEAFDYLAENVLTGKASAYFNNTFSYLHLSDRSDSPVVTVDDVNIIQYTIVLPAAPSYMERHMAQNLADAIYDATGVEVPIITDVIEEASYEILIGDTNRGETYVTEFFAAKRFAIVQYGSKLILRGGQIEATSAAVSLLTDMINNAVITAEPVHLPAGYCKTGNVDAYTINNFNGYELVFSDDFNSFELDTEVWNNYEHEIPSYAQDYNIMCYKPDSVTFNNRNMIIETYLGSDGYTSGSVDTYNKLRLQYGYVEVRARFRTAPGYWVKLMLTNQFENKETVSQIDVFNSLASSDTIFATAGTLSQSNYYEEHVDFVQPSYDGYRQGSLDYEQLINEEEYHTYGVEWTDDYIRFFIDGVAYGTLETTDKKFDSLNTEMYLSFFLGVEMTDQLTNDELAQWPAPMYVDWVRIYQREGQKITLGAPEVDTTSSNQSATDKNASSK